MVLMTKRETNHLFMMCLCVFVCVCKLACLKRGTKQKKMVADLLSAPCFHSHTALTHFGVLVVYLDQSN